MDKENNFASVRPKHEIRSKLIPTPLHGRRFGKELFLEPHDGEKETVESSTSEQPNSESPHCKSTKAAVIVRFFFFLRIIIKQLLINALYLVTKIPIPLVIDQKPLHSTVMDLLNDDDDDELLKSPELSSELFMSSKPWLKSHSAGLKSSLFSASKNVKSTPDVSWHSNLTQVYHLIINLYI